MKSRFTVWKDYKFDKYVFRSALLVMLLLLVVAFFLTGGLEKKIHLSCLNSVGKLPCENPLYENEVYRGRVPDYLLEEETIPYGFELNRPPFLAKYFGEITALIVVIFFLLNHALHNKGFSFKKVFKELEEELNRD